MYEFIDIPSNVNGGSQLMLSKLESMLAEISLGAAKIPVNSTENKAECNCYTTSAFTMFSKQNVTLIYTYTLVKLVGFK